MILLRRTLLGIGLALIASSARAGDSHDAKDEGFGSLTVDQVADLIAKGEVSVFDNNGKDRWQKSHVPTAKWVDFKDVKKSDLPQDHSRKLVFYCANEH
jgi:hypothetical protein